MVAGASIAFYALIGFEDAVNVAEETKDSTHTFPRTLFLGLGIAGTIYLLVTIVAGMAVPARRWPSPTARCSRWSRSARSRSTARCSA